MTNYINPSTYSGGAQQIVVPDRAPAPEVDEAPLDNTKYGRENGVWVPLNSADGASFQTLTVEGVTALVPIIAYSLTANVATIFTSRQHGFAVDDQVFVAGLGAPFDGAKVVTDVTPTSFLFAETAADVLYTQAPEGATVNKGTTLSLGEERRGLTIYGTEFLDWLDPLPKGMIAYGKRDSSLNNIPTTETKYLELQTTLLPGRMYRIESPSLYCSGILNQRMLTFLRIAYDGTAVGITSDQIGSARVIAAGVASAYRSGGMVNHINTSGWAAPREIRLLLSGAAEGSGTFNIVSNTTYPVEIIVEDKGLAVEDTGIDYSLAIPPVTLKPYVTTWTSTTACCYWGSGGKDESQGEEDMKQGYSSADGDSKSLWIFPSSMYTTLSGVASDANITKVRIYLYANHWWYGGGGTALIKRHGYASVPASSPSMSTVVSSTAWPRDAGRWVDITNVSGVKAALRSGAMRGIGVGPSGGTNLTYYGRFNKSGAKIEVSYKK